MTGPVYHRLLQYHVFPELKQWNGRTLERLVWQQVNLFLNMRSVMLIVGYRMGHPAT